MPTRSDSTHPLTTSPGNGSAQGLSQRSIQFLAELDSYVSMSPDRGYQTPTTAAIRNAKTLVTEADRTAIIPERVEPSAMGGVGVTFAADSREVAVEFYNNGTAHALFSDDSSGQMQTRSVPTDAAGYQELLKHTREYLDGE